MLSNYLVRCFSGGRRRRKWEPGTRSTTYPWGQRNHWKKKKKYDNSPRRMLKIYTSNSSSLTHAFSQVRWGEWHVAARGKPGPGTRLDPGRAADNRDKSQLPSASSVCGVVHWNVDVPMWFIFGSNFEQFQESTACILRVNLIFRLPSTVPSFWWRQRRQELIIWAAMDENDEINANAPTSVKIMKPVIADNYIPGWEFQTRSSFIEAKSVFNARIMVGQYILSQGGSLMTNTSYHCGISHHILYM